MTCLEIRERLPELALHALNGSDEDAVRRHLEWCAGCRKEEAALRAAAASLAFVPDPIQPPEDLEERVVDRVREAAGRPRRRTRTVVASLVAAAIAVAALGWGSVMAGRAERAEELADEAVLREETALARFDEMLSRFGVTASPDQTRMGRLGPPSGRHGGGVALMLVSPDVMDFVIVVVRGLDVDRSPYRIFLTTPRGAKVRVGRIDELDPALGGEEIYRTFFDRSLAPFERVVVRDANGEIALEGSIAPEEQLEVGAAIAAR